MQRDAVIRLLDSLDHVEESSNVATCILGQLRRNVELLLEEVHRFLVHQQRVRFLRLEYMVRLLVLSVVRVQRVYDLLVHIFQELLR